MYFKLHKNELCIHAFTPNIGSELFLKSAEVRHESVLFVIIISTKKSSKMLQETDEVRRYISLLHLIVRRSSVC